MEEIPSKPNSQPNRKYSILMFGGKQEIHNGDHASAGNSLKYVPPLYKKMTRLENTEL